MAAVSLIIKATRLCNLRCTYCHDWAAGPGNTMDFSVLLAMTKAVLADPHHDDVQFIWHGGETTLLPISFYRRAVLLQERLRRPGQTVRNVLQTNATRLDEQWIRFFADHGFRVGISLDGPELLHDRHRRYVSGQGSFADVRAGISRLRDGGIPFGVLMVIGPEAVAMGAQAVFDAFLDLGVREYGLIPRKPDNEPHAARGTPSEHYVGPAVSARFFADFYDVWKAHGDPGIVVRELRSIEGIVERRSGGICKLGGPCLGQYYLVEPSGEVAHCDLFLGDPDYTVGTVLEGSFADMRASAAMRALRARDESERAAMSDCPEFELCQGWCPHERYLAWRHEPGYTGRCCGLRPLIEHVRRRMSEDAVATAGVGPHG